jgi:hypothetical protein
MRFLTPIALAGLFITLTAVPAHADSGLLSKRDPKGDVSVYKTKKLESVAKSSLRPRRRA